MWHLFLINCSHFLNNEYINELYIPHLKNFFFCRQGLVNGLQEIDKLKSQVQDVHVPLEVFE